MDDLKVLQDREEAIIENIKKLNEQIYQAQNGVFNNSNNENGPLSEEDKLIQEKIDVVQGKLNAAAAKNNIKKSALEEKILNCKSRICRTQKKIQALTKEINFLNNNVMEFRDNVKKLENLSKFKVNDEIEEETKKRKNLEEELKSYEQTIDACKEKHNTEVALLRLQIKKTDKLKLQTKNDNCNMCYKITALEDEYRATKVDDECRHNLIKTLQHKVQDTTEKIIEETKKPDLGIDMDIINTIIKELSNIRRIFDESTSDEMVKDQLSSLAKEIRKINMLLKEANKDESPIQSQGKENRYGAEHIANQGIKQEQPQKGSNGSMQAINQRIKQESSQEAMPIHDIKQELSEIKQEKAQEGSMEGSKECNEECYQEGNEEEFYCMNQGSEQSPKCSEDLISSQHCCKEKVNRYYKNLNDEEEKKDHCACNCACKPVKTKTKPAATKKAKTGTRPSGAPNAKQSVKAEKTNSM